MNDWHPSYYLHPPEVVWMHIDCWTGSFPPFPPIRTITTR